MVVMYLLVIATEPGGMTTTKLQSKLNLHWRAAEVADSSFNHVSVFKENLEHVGIQEGRMQTRQTQGSYRTQLTTLSILFDEGNPSASTCW